MKKYNVYLNGHLSTMKEALSFTKDTRLNVYRTLQKTGQYITKSKGVELIIKAINPV